MIDPITTTELLFPGTTSQGQDPQPTDNNPVLKTFEVIIDHAVKTKLNEYQPVQQAAIQKAERSAELERKLAFLTGAVHQAEAALAAMEGTHPTQAIPSNVPQPDPAGLSLKKEDVLYWKAKLNEAGLPDGVSSLE